MSRNDEEILILMTVKIMVMRCPWSKATWQGMIDSRRDHQSRKSMQKADGIMFACSDEAILQCHRCYYGPRVG